MFSTASIGFAAFVLTMADEAQSVLHQHVCDLTDLNHVGFSQWAHQQTGSHPFQVLNPSVETGRIRIDGTTIFIGNARPNCSSLPGVSVFTPLDVGALCPWYWKVDYDPWRIPAALPVAECVCAAVKWAGISFECHPILYEMRALQFADANCNKTDEVELSLSVGCVAFRQAKEPNFRNTYEQEYMLQALDEKRRRRRFL